MKDINKTDKLEYLNTKIYITKGDFVFETGKFYDVVNGKILVDDIDIASSRKHKIPYQTSFKSDLDLDFYFMPYEKRIAIGKTLGIEPLGWSEEGVEFIDVNNLLILLKHYIKTSSKVDEVMIKTLFDKL